MDSDYTEPFWKDPAWRAAQMASLVAVGISARRADELIEKQVRRCREQDARDRAWEGEK